MQFTQLFDDDRAVSPVIGVILMVAITVILAAVIGTFVLGMSDQMGDTTPRATFGFDAKNSDSTDDTVDEVVITHESGASIAADELWVKVSGTTLDSQWGASGTDVGAGDTFTVADGDGGSTSSNSAGEVEVAGNTIRIVYDSPDSDSTTTLQKFEVPN